MKRTGLRIMSRTMLSAVKGLAAIVAVSLLLGTSAQPQAVRRLILTDGTFQTATEWQKVGDRVKYFSAERGEWEELPLSLVDWKATEQWNAERSRKDTEELKQVTAEDIAARKEEMLNTPQVAPNLRLPAEGGIFLFEEVAGTPALSKIDGTKIQVDEHVGKNMLKRSINPVSSQTLTIELKGAVAKLRVHTPAPSIFVDIDNEQGVIPAENFRIVRLDRKRDTRVVAKNKIAITGDQSTTERYLHTRTEKFSGDWWKLIPLEDLAPGEYAIVVSDGKGEDASVVWDFGVDK